jgi:carbamoyl-phosphate synthase large subunit
MRILTEASGSLVSGYLIKAIQEAGHEAVASDVSPDVAGRYLADDFIPMPSAQDPELWPRTGQLLDEHDIDLVIPSFDGTLVGWAQRLFDPERELPTSVMVSAADVIETFVDKWLAAEFFEANGIATPRTSLAQDHPLVKPRLGRGGSGVAVTDQPVDMTGMISQELAIGDEYTVDVLCDLEGVPLYVVPRIRGAVRDGKSTKGVVVRHRQVEDLVRRLCAATCFQGPVNVQVFADGEDVTVIEVNPRISGGMALGFAATENWIPLICRLLDGEEVAATAPVQWGMQMMRFYAEVFVSAR